MFECEIVYTTFPVREIAIPVTVSCGSYRKNAVECKGIVDTGATASMISKEIAEYLQLIPCGKVNVSGVHASQSVNTYLADVTFGNHTLSDLTLSEAGNSAGFDLLIGMDIIQRGELKIKKTGGRLFFSFILQ